ncbi:MAG: Ig-like domain-containing protein [Deltaproteobacteria bacterium]|nr:Ig-like domain-containing protein [Deltaproteobacteria bacterium]
MANSATWLRLWHVTVAFCAAAGVACGDPPLAPAALDVGAGAVADFAAGGLDGSGGRASADTAKTEIVDAATGPAEAPSGDAPAGDAQAGDSGPDGPTAPADAAFVGDGWDQVGDDGVAVPDAGLADFALVAVAPPAGATGLAHAFSITLTFSADLKAAAATKNTIAVTTNGGVGLPCKFAVAGKQLTITPIAAAPAASRVAVVLGTLVQSYQGVPLQETALSWYTADWADQAGYAQLAERFAPTVRQAIGGPSDYLRAPDFDGDWLLADNPKNAADKPALGQVAWAATETRSHLYLTYLYYWPARSAVAPGVPFDNDTAGAMVVVDRKTQLPVALQTFFKAKSDEQSWLWTATEAGWPTKSKFIRAVVPRDQLFEVVDAPGCADATAASCKRRHPAYLTAGSHQSCLWTDAGEVADQQCVLNAATKAALKVVQYQPAPVATAAALPDGNATYALVPLLQSWWLHRDESGPAGPFVDTQFVYVPAQGRPTGPGYGLGSKLVSAKTDDFARPPWAWRWKPGTLSASYYDLPRGAAFLDPAWQMWHRLGGETAGLAKWDEAKKTGFSTDYCFNAYLGIDVRKSEPCQLGP